MKNINTNRKIESVLKHLQEDFFEARNMDSAEKKKILGDIKEALIKNQLKLKDIVIKEVRLNAQDAQKEVDRAIKTFTLAEANYNYSNNKKTKSGKRIIIERRIARGPLFAITPFSSPLSSPSHKIALGILAGTSILFKPSSQAAKTGKVLFDIISTATKNRYIRFLDTDNESELNGITSDERIGVISFTGGYDTGKKILASGGIKKYHMELSGGNSLIIFTPTYKKYDDYLIDKITDGVMSKNGQRCVSIKHLFIPTKHKDFISRLQLKIDEIHKSMLNDLLKNKAPKYGPLINKEYASHFQERIEEIISNFKNIKPLIRFERKDDYIFPCLYEFENIEVNTTRSILEYDLPGPILFIHVYNNGEYKKIIDSLSNEYIRSGLQLSIFTDKPDSIVSDYKDIIWGGIIVNDIPTFRDDFISFGGFGKAGLGKEGFFETLQIYTDPQVVVINDAS